MWKATVAIKNAARAGPFLESCVFTFWLGLCVDKREAVNVFEGLGFCIPDKAYVIFEEMRL